MKVFVLTGYDDFDNATLTTEVYADMEKANARVVEKLIDYIEMNDYGPFEPEKLEVYKNMGCLYDGYISVAVEELEVIK